MFYHLFYQAIGDATFLRVFRYITFRAAMAALFSLFFTLIVAPYIIRKLREHQFGQMVRDDGPQSHLKKQGTPTMGGVLILISLLGSTLLWARLDTMMTWVVVLLTAGFGIVGFLDDFLKISKRNTRGLRGSIKIVTQFAMAFFFVIVLLVTTGVNTDLSIPFVWNVLSNTPAWFFIPFAAIVIVGSANAVNLTDGADGLAIGPVMTTTIVYGILAYVAGNSVFAGYLHIPHIKYAGELSVFCGALLGSSLAFLWYNAHPAEIFMGDVGSLSLGAALGTVAVATKNELLLVLVGGVFVLEAVSVILQVASFKLTGKRIFRMAPYHHSLELRGWPEEKMVVRLWIISIILALLGLAALKLRFNF